ncbi:hypoxia-inducible factor 1-alpha-like [Limulus polyphemus]|uniref:Hypoxia-inducible factor 1-alpha-like n=1 Tax=Limulus polyphemus TaxID=6850 RepID=A0ABM1TGL0_LIMPO|nr:hypoxia-inducible factor 1-alpha-like [Limulus polyphemus]
MENSEKRKEKSRDAARSRRSKETEIYSLLASQLPFACSQLDKASLMRLTISYLRIRQLLNPVAEAMKHFPSNARNWDLAILKALEGFLLILSEEGDLVYLSENVHQYLGLNQLDLMGHSIYDFSHPCDHEEIKEMLSLKSNENCKLLQPQSFFLRMKCTLTNKGRNVNVKSASYKVIHCTGYIMNNIPVVKMETHTCKANFTALNYFVSLAEPIPHPSNIEITLDKQTFLSQHSLDMKFTYVDERIEDFLEYKREELLGKSAFQYHHVLDTRIVEKNYKIMFSKGQCETGPYRFLAKHGGYVWLLTQGTVIYENNSTKPQCVVCVHYVLSGIENLSEVVSDEQVKNKMETSPESFALRSSTNKLFCHCTEGMTKGLMMFTEGENGLTDIFRDMIQDNKILPGKNLITEVPSPLSGCSSPLNCDSFLQYREDSLYSPLSSETMSSSLSKSGSSSMSDLRSNKYSVSMEDLPALESPMEPLSNWDLKYDSSKVFADKETDIQDEEFIGRAPYISMTTADDYPLFSLPEREMWESQEHPRRRSLSHSPSRAVINMKEFGSCTTLSPTVSKFTLSPSVPMETSFTQDIRSRKDRSMLLMDRKHKNIRTITSRSLSPSGIDHGGGNSKIDLSVHKHMPNGEKVITLEGLPKSQAVMSIDKSHIRECPVQFNVPKVCVTLAEEKSVPAEATQLVSSLPFKRACANFQPALNSLKRMKFGNEQNEREGHSTNAGVLLNLFMNEDANHGYLNCDSTFYTKSSPPSPLISRYGYRTSTRVSLPDLLHPEGIAIPTLADVTHHDAEVNAPLHSNHLLQGEDLLHALDHVSSLV